MASRGAECHKSFLVEQVELVEFHSAKGDCLSVASMNGGQRDEAYYETYLVHSVCVVLK